MAVNNTSHRNEFAEMLEGMTKQELAKYGVMTYGLSLSTKYSKQDLIAYIQDAARKFKGNDSIQIGEHLKSEELPPGCAEIQLHRTELNKNQNAAIVGLNGKMASLPIGNQFWCPLEYVEILKNAQRIEYEQDWTSDPPKLIPREIHSYPFTIHRISPHTPASLAESGRKRSLKTRAPGAAMRKRAAREAAEMI